MKKIVVFTGAGISAESGINTFRDSDGLWENYAIEDVATPEAWEKDAELVLNFYNMRRKQILEVEPNIAHQSLKQLEDKFDVEIITQNIDDLHERAHSSKILHLHGEILMAKSSSQNNKQYKIKGEELNIGESCDDGFQLRPDVVWFGEAVPNMMNAESICNNANILIIIGTSLNVYPAANIINFVPDSCEIYLIDPKDVPLKGIKNLTIIKNKATVGVPNLVNELINQNL